MSKQMKIFRILFIIIILLIDLYSYKGVIKTFPKLLVANVYLIFTIGYFIITLFFIVSVIVITNFNFYERRPEIFSGFYLFAGIFLMIYLPKLVFAAFHLTEDFIQILTKSVVFIINHTASTNIRINRVHFISKTGIILAIVPFLALGYGMTLGRFNYEISKIKLELDTLPKGFSGLKIIHISDLHLGSVYNKKEKIAKMVDKINDLQPDLILFTGDLVNNFSEEAVGWEDILGKLNARYGKYSVLGNHDYGDYWQWKNEKEKETNMDLLISIYKKMGFKLLMNEAAVITYKDDSIALLGVENWGHPPFKQYGNLRKAQSFVNGTEFKILLSHDPSHWKAEIAGKTDINLTLSGHTHAMQIGIKLNGFSWSPSKYFYKQWNGLYKHNDQYLYVNRGLGFIGFPGRVGMRPEITSIEIYNPN
jgi:predicted MPP superfamily phosphohydrolase